LLDGLRAEAHLRTLTYHKVVAQLYNCRVQPRRVVDNDLVLRKAEVNGPGRTRGKLALNWEGQYRVVRTVRDGIYVLAAMDGQILPRTWHISNLKKFNV
ncbi:hypothetical protein B296_00034828, partial [Ensete ventricosum]